MEPIRLRLQEYRLALLIFRAGCLLAFNRLTNVADRPRLIYDLFEYCYYRYFTFDTRIDVSLRNKYSVKSKLAKDRIIVYLQRNKDDRAKLYCDMIFGVDNWSYVLLTDYMNHEG